MFSWSDIDQRNQQKQEAERKLKDFLQTQQEEVRRRYFSRVK